MKKKLKALKEEIDSWIIMFRVFTTSLSIIDRITRHRDQQGNWSYGKHYKTTRPKWHLQNTSYNCRIQIFLKCRLHICGAIKQVSVSLTGLKPQTVFFFQFKGSEIRNEKQNKFGKYRNTCKWNSPLQIFNGSEKKSKN